ncbi:hypothetical protein Acsp03_63590 [Actinomadura sp. NBRC 104412]|nr:hypothetical protein Acsp03_63590 [Actinomadura sp. NBRC 104412]
MLSDIVHHRDPRMLEGGRDLGFTSKTLDTVGPTTLERQEELDGDRSIEAAVHTQPDLTHRALADGLRQKVSAVEFDPAVQGTSSGLPRLE